MARWRRELAAAFGEGTPETRQGRALAPLVAAVPPAARVVRGAHRRGRDGPRPAPLRDVRRSLRVLHPRRVGGRADLPGDLRLRGSAARGSTRSISASRCSSRTSSATCPRISRAAGSTSRRRISGATGAPRRIWRARPRRPARACVSSAVKALLRQQGAARARLLPRAADGLPRRDARRLAAAEIMGAIYRAILDRIERRGLRRLHARRPDAAAAARADRGRHLGADGDRRAAQGRSEPPRPNNESPPDVVVIGAGFAGLSAAAALAGARRAGARARRAAAARRPRHGVHRSRDRRAGRQRPARAVRLLPRDVRVPAADRRAATTSASSRRWKSPYLDPRAAGRCCAARRCRRRCTCWPACSTGTRCRGAIGCRRCGWPARCAAARRELHRSGTVTAEPAGHRVGVAGARRPERRAARVAVGSAGGRGAEPVAGRAGGGAVRARARGDVRAGSRPRRRWRCRRGRCT